MAPSLTTTISTLKNEFMLKHTRNPGLLFLAFDQDSNCLFSHPLSSPTIKNLFAEEEEGQPTLMSNMVTINHEDLFPSNFFCQPWLIQSNHRANRPTQIFIDPTDGSIKAKEIAEMQGTTCFGCIDEWLFLWDGQTKECFFLEPNSLSKVHCPALPKSPDCLMSFSLSSYVNDLDCTIIFIGSEIIDNHVGLQSFFLHCRPNADKTWTKLPIKGQYLVGETNAIHEGKLYAYNYDNVVVFDVPSLLKGQIDMTTLLPPKRPMYLRAVMSNLSLVESCGNIYLVRINSYGNYYGESQANYIDIHLLDVTSKSWLRVDSIGDRAFFLGGRYCYASVRASDAGADNNCIYYMSFFRGMKYERRVCKFYLDDHTMTLILVPDGETKYESTFCWFVPTRARSIQKASVQSKLVLNEATREENETLAKEETINDTRPWNELPIDLLELLVPYLSLVDGVRLPAVCKEWTMMSNPIPKAKTWPWLMNHELANGMCKLLDPFYMKEYRTKIRKISWGYQTQMLSSKDGWVLVLDGDFSVFMINPLLLNLIELPHLEGIKGGFHGATFTSVPTSHDDCIVFGFSTIKFSDSVEIFQWRPGEKKWNVTSIDIRTHVHLEAANTNPVFFHGELYCLGEFGYVWSLNTENKTFRVLDIPRHVVYPENVVSFIPPQDGYLLELGLELVSVFINNYSSYGVSVFKLDIMKMEWIEIGDLANWTIFLDRRSSFAMPSPHKSWSNKIFFSAYHSSTSTCATYCMESKRFNMNFTDTKKPLDCVWLEPNLTGI